MQIMNIHQAKTNLSQLIEKALQGEDVIIAKAGKPIVKLVAYKAKLKPRKPGLLKGKISIPDNFTDEDPDINKLFFGE
ncbi:MAG TPA: type II toxin-antitoxin system Phd/YefM family antitoxin [Candidatus Saccharimonadales bacterium]|nr:type II toxin-antitoxin system Phd/YefM family antitoxin [Candidatus Saccharimonadales bacterium]